MCKAKVQRCEQHNIRYGTDFYKFVDEMCFKSKNLYNYANYIIRQEFINNGNWIKYNQLFQLGKHFSRQSRTGRKILVNI